MTIKFCGVFNNQFGTCTRILPDLGGEFQKKYIAQSDFTVGNSVGGVSFQCFDERVGCAWRICSGFCAEPYFNKL